MGLEAGTYIDDLNSAWPLGGDQVSFGPHHIRLIKATIKATFPNVTGPVTLTQGQLNIAVLKTNYNILTAAFVPATLVAPIQLESSTPGIFFKETDAALNEKYWGVYASSTRLRWIAVSDDGATSTEWMTVYRLAGGIVPASIDFNLPIVRAMGDFTALGEVNVGHGTDTPLIRTRAGHISMGGIEVGYLHVPQNAQVNSYTCVLEDNGKHIFHSAGAGAGEAYTIPANASVAYPLGATLTFINRSVSPISIAITTDTLTLAGTTLTGTRTLALNGIATAIKDTTTGWLISGTGLS